MSAKESRRGIQRGTEMQSCGIGLFWLLVSLYEVAQNNADRFFFAGPPPRGVWGKFLSALLCTTL